jgi:hypothetical protein
MAHCHCLLFLKHKEDKTHKKRTKKKTKRREGASLQIPALPFHFWLLLLPFYFKCFLFKHKKKKPIRKKRNAEKGRNSPSSSHSALSLLAPTSALPLLHFCFKHFLLASFSSQAKQKNKKQRKKM